MKYLLVLYVFLGFSSVFGEKIGSIEFALPKAAKDWVVHHKLESKKGTTIFYGPKDMSENKELGDNFEFFAVNYNPYFTDIQNVSLIEKGLTHLLPGMDVDFCVLKLIKSRLIYEWSAKKEGVEHVHGWGEIFVSHEGTVLLSYQTKKLSNLEKARAIWLPVLAEAKRQQL